MSFKGVNGIFILEVRIQKLTNRVVYVQENPNKIVKMFTRAEIREIGP